jgi:hypothetical protein
LSSLAQICTRPIPSSIYPSELYRRHSPAFSAIVIMSWLASSAAPVRELQPPTDRVGNGEGFGPLTPADTEWLCAGGFATETQIWYLFTPSGALGMVQVIHSAVG